MFTYANVGCLKVNLFQRPEILYLVECKRRIFSLHYLKKGLTCNMIVFVLEFDVPFM